MTNDDADEKRWVALVGEEAWLSVPESSRNFLLKTAGSIPLTKEEADAITCSDDAEHLGCLPGKVIEFDSPEEAQYIMGKIQEAAKHREWWEKLKGEQLRDQESEDEVSDFLAKTMAGIMIRRMLQIEEGKK